MATVFQMFSISLVPSACPGLTLRKHTSVHAIRGSRMSFKEIIFE